MIPSPAALFEPVTRLTQANLATWTQFWMSPDQPWSPTRQDLFGSRPFSGATGASGATVEALNRLWSGLFENQSRFIAEMGQRTMTAWQAAPQVASDAVREATPSTT